MTLPLQIVGYAVWTRYRLIYAVTAVRFDIRFVYHINTFVIGDFEHYRIWRIMRRTYGVDVEFLHKVYVRFEFLRRHYVSVLLIGIVMVYAFEFNRLIVEIEYVADYIYSLDAYFLSYALNNFAIDDKLNIHGIQIGSFRAPKFGIRQVEFRLTSYFAFQLLFAKAKSTYRLRFDSFYR